MMRVVYVVPALNNGGTEKFLINMISHSPSNWENTIITYGKNNYWRNYLIQKNVNVLYASPPSVVGIIKNMFYIYKMLKKIKPDVVCSYTYYNAAFVLFAAFLCGIRTRIAHAHTSHTEHTKTFIYRMYVLFAKILLQLVATHKIACSRKAGKSLFFGHFLVVNNGIDLEKYAFNCRYRKEIRDKYGIKKKTLVIGAVGRIDKNKNYGFMIKIIKNLVNTYGIDAKLMVVGDGVERKKIEKIVEDNRLNDFVIFVGNVDDAYKYYSSFDIFLLTSYNEGAPYVLVEAQANGLPSVVSLNVDKDIMVNDNMVFANLKSGEKEWSRVILNDERIKRVHPSEMLSENYSLEYTVETMEKIFKSRLGRREGDNKW